MSLIRNSAKRCINHSTLSTTRYLTISGCDSVGTWSRYYSSSGNSKTKEYGNWTVKRLKDECQLRNINFEGKKKDHLVKLLRNSDKHVFANDNQSKEVSESENSSKKPKKSKKKLAKSSKRSDSLNFTAPVEPVIKRVDDLPDEAPLSDSFVQTEESPKIDAQLDSILKESQKQSEVATEDTGLKKDEISINGDSDVLINSDVLVSKSESLENVTDLKTEDNTYAIQTNLNESISKDTEDFISNDKAFKADSDNNLQDFKFDEPIVEIKPIEEPIVKTVDETPVQILGNDIIVDNNISLETEKKIDGEDLVGFKESEVSTYSLFHSKIQRPDSLEVSIDGNPLPENNFIESEKEIDKEIKEKQASIKAEQSSEEPVKKFEGSHIEESQKDNNSSSLKKSSIENLSEFNEFKLENNDSTLEYELTNKNEVDESTEKDEQVKQVEELQKIEELISEESSKVEKPIVEKPIVEKPIVKEELIVEESSKVEEQPIVDKSSKVEEPIVKEEPIVDESSKVEESVVGQSIAEKSSKTEESVIEEQPIVKEEDIIREEPKSEETPKVEEKSNNKENETSAEAKLSTRDKTLLGGFLAAVISWFALDSFETKQL
ncbi:uncharacterized protein ASCRUDRAFT_9999 [Ascoidea rubescens DSM 1968]|uniref:SAP domain-containing protein n=1 Tax=Ascoidea rubescens DSM 1968 TaxID=1344418 RepID=A0A1D2VAK4_9ASCO|nr:hypothetical protein ASCRUDRAFT_9999 [Ascoidea rubescens DSM 1968]ODV58651.1 hypothetical protein ASCRUDRAFT_9999 [Ascoidea rubescens DSM 1968]